MNRPFAIYPDSFDGATLGHWRFGEGGGRLVAVVNAKTLTNHGTEAGQDGRRFVRADGDYMDAVYLGEPARSQVTLECWVRDFKNDLGQHAQIAAYGLGANDYLGILVGRNADPLLSYITAAMIIGSVLVGYARWYYDAAVDALLASPKPWHVAAVLDATASLKLFVNGTLRATDTTGIVALPTGNCLLRLGRHITDWAGYDLSAVLDEIRVSTVARYTSDFTPVRYGEGRRAVVRGPGLDGLFAGVAA